MDTQILPLTRPSYPEAIEVLAQAFSTYPLMDYIYAVSKVSILESVRAMFTVSCEIRDTFGWPVLGITDNADKLVGVALLDLPGETEWPEALKQKHTVYKEIVGEAAAERLSAFANLSDSGRPEEPHISLSVLGVLPQTQGQGYGGRLLDHVSALSEQDTISTGVWLDTETEHNVGYYQKYGYQVLAHNKLDDVVDVWGMFRPNSI